jgi:hypothetical protein
MKQKEIIMLGSSFLAAILVALLADKLLFSNSATTGTQVDVVPVISTDFKQPASQYFNPQAIDPTQIINIGPNNSQTPFNSK